MSSSLTRTSPSVNHLDGAKRGSHISTDSSHKTEMSPFSATPDHLTSSAQRDLGSPSRQRPTTSAVQRCAPLLRPHDTGVDRTKSCTWKRGSNFDEIHSGVERVNSPWTPKGLLLEHSRNIPTIDTISDFSTSVITDTDIVDECCCSTATTRQSTIRLSRRPIWVLEDSDAAGDHCDAIPHSERSFSTVMTAMSGNFTPASRVRASIYTASLVSHMSRRSSILPCPSSSVTSNLATVLHRYHSTSSYATTDEIEDPFSVTSENSH